MMKADLKNKPFSVANVHNKPTRCALAVAIALTAGVASAARIKVDGESVSVIDDGNCSLQEAILAANTDKAVDNCLAGNGADVIILQGKGQYILQNIFEELQGFNGLPTITSEITIRGNNAVIKRPSDGGFDKFRIFRVDSGNLTLDKVTIENGVADFKGNGPFGPGVYGGGVVATDSTVTLQSSTVTGCSATTGGGISTNNTELIIIDSNITNNEGGGVNTANSIVSIEDSHISYNNAEIGAGLNLIGTTLSMINSSVSGNHADSYGGGINGQDRDGTVSTLDIQNSTIRNNSTGIYDGGGLHLGNGSLALSSSTISENSSARDGGGIKLDENAQGAIVSSTVARNSAGRGGGGVEMWSDKLEIANSTISTNTAQTLGGGVTAWYGASVTVTNSTIAENSAQEGGGGAYTDTRNSSIFFKNSIVANNKGSKNCTGTGITDSSGSNLFGDESCSGVSQGNPKLGPLQINGKTSLETHALLGGSPAIDRGDNSICEGSLVANLDERGFKRPFDGNGDGSAICDIGAHENQNVQAPPADGGIQPAHSGVWFDNNRNGEGYFIYVSDNGGQRSVTITYYTYDNGKQMWLIGTQQVTPGFSTVTVPMTVTSGTSFSNFNPKEVGRKNWGTLSLTFTSCNSGTITYASPEFGSGDVSITPLAVVSGIACNSEGF